MLADPEVEHPAVAVALELLGRELRRARTTARPSGVVLLDSARSAEPPHSSGSVGAIAVRISPEALRVATPFGSASYVGRWSAQPSRERAGLDAGRRAPCRRRFLAAQASYSSCQAACAASRPRSTSERVCASTSSETSNVWSGSKPRTFLVAATSSSPRADPWALPVFWAVGRGPGDDRAQHDQAGLVGDLVGLLERLPDRVDVLGVLVSVVGPVDGLDVPAVGLVALADVLAEGDVGVALDGDPVGVVDQRSGCRAAGGRRSTTPRR